MAKRKLKRIRVPPMIDMEIPVSFMRKAHKKLVNEMLGFEPIKKKHDFPQPDVGKYEIAVAVKKDDEKVKMHLLPPKALLGIAKIMSYGALKYNNFNYKLGKGLEWDRMLSACYRHLNAWNDGEDNDKESGESHLYHAGCCIMMLIDLVETKKGKDTRYKG